MISNSLARQMVRAASQAPRVLGESTDLVRQFLWSQLNADGGFRGRDQRSDLYYTVFALLSLKALGAPLPVEPCAAFLRQYGVGDQLDLVHLACLARCWALLAGEKPETHTAAQSGITTSWVEGVKRFRAQNGGFHPVAGNPHGSAYGAFLVLGYFEDIGAPVSDSARLIASLADLATADGAFGNEKGLAQGATPPTSAVVEVLHQMAQPVPDSVRDWLFARWHSRGGFVASPTTRAPDLLSTAVTLHALAKLRQDLTAWREQGLDFVDSLWTNEGSFFAHWGESVLDCEYTFYGLLALGNLAPDATCRNSVEAPK